jgi:integrase
MTRSGREWLTDRKIKDWLNAAGSKEDWIADGGGLYLRHRGAAAGATPSAAWTIRFTAPGTKERAYHGLGPYPAVSLIEARRRAVEAKGLIAKGVDPRHVEASPTAPEPARTFEVLALEMVEKRAGSGKWREDGSSKKDWLSSFRRYVFPEIGDKALDQVTVADIVGLLTKARKDENGRPFSLWADRSQTAQRLRNRIEIVFSFNGRSPNVAIWEGNIEKHLKVPIHETQSHVGLPVEAIPAFLERLRAADWLNAAAALEFLLLTGVRTGNVLTAKWDQFDFDNGVWTVPITKNGLPFRVPLSAQALAVLPPRGDARPTEHVFGYLWEDKLRHLMRSLGYTEASPHGFRTSLNDWMEANEVDPTLADMMMQHKRKGVRRTNYGVDPRTGKLGDFLDKRRSLMQRWADAICLRPL